MSANEKGGTEVPPKHGLGSLPPPRTPPKSRRAPAEVRWLGRLPAAGRTYGCESHRNDNDI